MECIPDASMRQEKTALRIFAISGRFRENFNISITKAETVRKMQRYNNIVQGTD